jgi:hypothetical protein
VDYRFRNLAWFLDMGEGHDECRGSAYTVYADPGADYDFDVMWFSNAWYNIWEAPVSGRIIVNANNYHHQMGDEGGHLNKHLPRNWFFA